MALDITKEIFYSLYKDIDGMAISKAARAKLTTWYMGHIYGEVTYDGFKKLLALAHPKKNEIFYDLGSGTGKGILLAALFAEFSKVVGVELLKDLHETSVQVLRNYRALTTKDNSHNTSIELIHGNFQEVDFSDADVIYINATCMQYEINLPFERKLEKLKIGTRVITNTVYLSSDLFKITNVGKIEFTWGEEECFIHEKIA